MLHIVILALGLGAATGEMVTGGQGAGTPEVSAVTISLAGVRGSRQASEQTDASRLKILYAKALADQAEVYASDQKPTPHGSLQALFDTIERNHAPPSPPGTDAASGHGAGDSSGAKGDPNAARPSPSASAKAAVGPGSSASSGDLWGQVESCWRRVPDRSSVPVSLEIYLDRDGRIARPPTVLRSAAAPPDQRRLIAEARALTAIAACVPYRGGDMMGLGGQFRLDFGVSGGQ